MNSIFNTNPEIKTSKIYNKSVSLFSLLKKFSWDLTVSKAVQKNNNELIIY